MYIQTKAILSVLLLIVGLSAVFLFLYYEGNKLAYERNIEHLSANIHNHFELRRMSFEEKYTTRLRGFISTNSDIIKAFKAKDRDLLYQLTIPKYNIIKSETKYLSNFAYLLPDATVLLRMQKPDYHGDNVGHIPFIQHVLKDKVSSTGFAVTKFGASYRIVQPVYDDEQFIGAVGWAFDISLLLEHIRQAEGLDYGVLVDSKRYDSYVIPGQKRVNVEDNVIVASSDLEKFYSSIEKGIDTHKKNQTLGVEGKEYLFQSTPLINFAGFHIGDILFALDITPEKLMFKRQITNAVVITLIIVSLSFIILYVSFGRLIGKIEKLNETLEQRVKERTAELEESLDEVKVLSGLLPICSSCKNIRDDSGYWSQIEQYIGKYSNVEFSHSICPDCVDELYPELSDKIKKMT